MSILVKIWAWLKKYWKWIIFPIGLIGILAAFIAGRLTRSTPTPIVIDNGDDAEEALEETRRAAEARDAKLKELREKHQNRLESLSVEQQKELDELKDKPFEEVVSWFDRI